MYSTYLCIYMYVRKYSMYVVYICVYTRMYVQYICVCMCVCIYEQLLHSLADLSGSGHCTMRSNRPARRSAESSSSNLTQELIIVVDCGSR